MQISSFLIIDEIPLLNVGIVEAIDTACQLLTGIQEPFGGKIVIAIGDFRQVAPIVKHGSELDTYQASILSWPVWQTFTTLELFCPICNAQDLELCQFVDSIGEDTSCS